MDELEIVRALRPSLAESRAETERTRRLAPQLVAALDAANLFRLAVPRADGGLEAAPPAALSVLEELASVDAASAWIVWNHMLPALMSRFLDGDVRRTLLAGPAHMIANSTRPTGQAVRVPDGFRIKGRWSLVSGCELADHMLLRAIVAPPTAATGGPPEMIMAYLPHSVCRILDTWHSGGLRGTGSHDVVVEDAFVLRSHCVWFDQPLQLTAALYRMPFAALLSAGCGSLCLGIAAGALQTLTELAQTKQLTDVPLSLRDQPRVLSELARMHSSLTAARLLLHDTTAQAWRSCEANEPVSIPARANMFAAAQHAAKAALQIVRSSYELAGASALYESCPIERAHRDIHAATQHVILSELWLEDAGRVALGVAPRSPLFVV
ncbi:MAG TPA: acyl-CoA dehydrogenase family protein [Polyangiales bacterium]|nr:acyl-CoA dehydrogenase family protein [Polyangiales bacterium]